MLGVIFGRWNWRYQSYNSRNSARDSCCKSPLSCLDHYVAHGALLPRFRLSSSTVLVVLFSCFFPFASVHHFSPPLCPPPSTGFSRRLHSHLAVLYGVVWLRQAEKREAATSKKPAYRCGRRECSTSSKRRGHHPKRCKQRRRRQQQQQ